jgi:hypothetical protein
MFDLITTAIRLKLLVNTLYLLEKILISGSCLKFAKEN